MEKKCSFYKEGYYAAKMKNTGISISAHWVEEKAKQFPRLDTFIFRY